MSIGMGILIGLLLLLVPLWAQELQQTCAYKKGNGVDLLHMNPVDPVDVFTLKGRQYVRGCRFCYTIWTEDNVIIGQGCWMSSDGCQHDQCVMHEDNSRPSSVQACCCQGHNCNENVVKNTTTEMNLVAKPQEMPLLEGYDGWTTIAIYATSSVVLLATLILVSVLIMRHCGVLSNKANNNSIRNNNICLIDEEKGEVDQQTENCPPRNYCQLSSLTFEAVIGQGRYGTVYKARSQQQNSIVVAVKVFTQAQKQGFFNERDIYEMMTASQLSNNCAGLLQYFGSHQMANVDGETLDLLLVLEHADHGSLCSYLKTHTVGWSDLCRMLLHISQGLSFLHHHSGLKGEKSVCHRDLNSRNIVVRSDLSCCICDFGFSMQIMGPHYYRNGVEQNAEKVSLSDVGTVRYMAPELLDCALNLRDCEAALKQVDVYSMGLVFWELSRRCRDLYQGVEVPEYELPFEQEIGSHPTFEQMQVLVSRNKARPLFPQVWKDSNPAIQQLRETIEDSWDHDGEARITASCVVERVRELSLLWDRYKQTSQGPPLLEAIIPNNTSSTVSSSNILKPQCFKTNVLPQSVEGMTKNDNILSGQQPLAKIQPHQGRNPCMERNFYNQDMEKTSDDEECQLLIERSAKDPPRQRPRNDEIEPRFLAPASERPYLQPIPYLQNDLNSSEADIKVESEEQSKWFRKNKKKGSKMTPRQEPKSNVERARRQQQLTD